MSVMSRLFIAIHVSENVKSELARVQQELMRQFRRSQVSWVAPKNFHITLHFIGDVTHEQVASLQGVLAVQDYVRPFTIALSYVSAFPHPKKPQVLVVQTSTHPSLFVLHRRIANVLLAQGLPIDHRPFTSHITLGRVKVASETLSGVQIPVESLQIEVSTFALMESNLSVSGSTYCEIQSFAVTKA